MPVLGANAVTAITAERLIIIHELDLLFLFAIFVAGKPVLLAPVRSSIVLVLSEKLGAHVVTVSDILHTNDSHSRARL